VSHGRGERDWLTKQLLNLLGLGTEGLQRQLAIRDEGLLFYAGLLGVPTRPAAALEQLLCDYFGVDAQVEQFVGAWYPLEQATQCALDQDVGGSTQLGLGAVAGDELWDLQSRVRVRIGPLTREQYEQFLPGGTAHEPLRALTRFFGNDQVDFEIQLVLARDEVPPCTLGGDEELALGWCTWIRTVPFGRDADETTFTLSDVRAPQ
jgi:type VI secretion system protein ImpH